MITFDVKTRFLKTRTNVLFQGEDNYAFEMEMGDAPKSPWRVPHLMFRESRKHKTVSFKKSNGKNGNFVKTHLIPK